MSCDEMAELDITGKQNGKSYEEILSLVKAGEVQLYLIVSPPRTLSTAWGKAFSSGSDVGLWLNEPTSKFHSGEARVVHSYEVIRNAIDMAEPSGDGVKRLVLSIISSTLGPDREAYDLFKVAQKISFLVRNPVLSSESFLILIGRIVHALGSPPKTKQALVDEHWLEATADLSHIAGDDPAPWLTHIEHTASTRDYRSLTDTFMYHGNAMLSSPSFRREAWSDPKRLLPWAEQEGDKIAGLWQVRPGLPRSLIDRCIDMDIEEIERSVPFLSNNLTQLPNGWQFLSQHFDLARWHYPEKLAGVVDATEIQRAPERCMALLRRRMGLGGPVERDKALKVADGYAKAFAVTDITQDLLFGRALGSQTIDPPDKSPLAFQRLPGFVRESLDGIFWCYLRLLLPRDQRVKPYQDAVGSLGRSFTSRRGQTMTVLDLDPVYSYVTALLADRESNQAAAPCLDQLRHEQDGYRAYFDLIDAARAKL